MKHNHLIAALAAAALGCGGSRNNGATSRNNPGTGTSTLLVTGTITGTIVSGAPTTAFSVTVKDGLNANVTGATVQINNPTLGIVDLTETPASSGIYLATKPDFPEGDFQLAVTKGNDTVSGVVVGGPGKHTINAPKVNDTVTANQPLPVSWTTPSQAKQATVSTRSFTGASVADLGAYTILAANNPARAGQRLTIARSNEVDIAGGLTGSSLRVTFTATVDPYTVQ